jgi:8-oxo-dGTP pyrophosphatase MutT (NUDIX family)
VRRKNVLGQNEVAKVDGSRGALKAAAAPPPPAHAPSPRVRVVLPYNGQYLLETLNNPKWPDNLGKRRFIGGGVDAGETNEQAAARELFEELGVKVKPTAFRYLGADPNKPHEHYLELPKHKIAPGDYNASVGSDPVISLSQGLPGGADYMGADIKQLLAPAIKKFANTKDVLPGGEADHVPDSAFNPEALSEGKTHEREHTNDGQVAEEIAKDHLSEDPAYYKKIEQVEKGASVYLDQALRMYNPLTVTGPTAPYDQNKPMLENVQNQLSEVKRRGDFMLQADRNHRIWRAQLDPNYRYQLAIQSFRGELPQPGLTDQLIERYGDGALASLNQRRP